MSDFGSRGHRRALRPGTRASGFTLLELVVVLAVAAIATAGLLGLRPGAAVRAAEAARSFLLWGRLEAMWTGRAVAVTPDAVSGLVARAATDGASVDACTAPVVRHLPLRRLGRVEVVEELRVGIVWMARGGARSCDGGGVISGRMVFGDRSRRVDVVVSSLGRVRVEVER